MLNARRVWLMIPVLLVTAALNARAEQTLVFMRHGEKPSGGYGQLTCQGLNRALALPGVLAAGFGRPNYLYAPDPTVKVPDPAGEGARPRRQLLLCAPARDHRADRDPVRHAREHEVRLQRYRVAAVGVDH